MTGYQNMRCWRVALTVAGLLPTITEGVGFRLPNQDPEAIARGNAYAATADNPSAIYYNPAGITQMEGQNIRVGVYAVSAGLEYKSGAKDYKAKSDVQPVPQLYYTISPKDLPLSFGLGIYCPYGLALDWGDNTSLRTEAEKGHLTYVCVNPVAAWKILPNLSIAMGPTFNYSEADFERGIGVLPNDKFHLKGDGWGYGMNAGVRWQPDPKWAVGLNYRSMSTVQYEGPAEITPAALTAPGPNSTTADASIRFPQFVVFGVSFRPTPKWNIECDVDWTDWDSVNQIVMHRTPVGTVRWPLNYRASLMYEIGVTRQLPKNFFASVGYFYSENSSPDRDFNSLIPDTNLQLGSFGFGHKGRRFDWMIAYHFGYNPGREVRGATTFPQANGTYEVFNQAVNVAATFKF